MTERAYWLTLFTARTWNQFLESGGEIAGFPPKTISTFKRIAPGDYLICYLIGLCRWVSILEVVSEPFIDEKPIWENANFPGRVKVNIIVGLTPNTAIPVNQFKEQLVTFKKSKNRHEWSSKFRTSPSKWESVDGELIVKKLLKAEENPVVYPFEKLGKLRSRVRP